MIYCGVAKRRVCLFSFLYTVIISHTYNALSEATMRSVITTKLLLFSRRSKKRDTRVRKTRAEQESFFPLSVSSAFSRSSGAVCSFFLFSSQGLSLCFVSCSLCSFSLFFFVSIGMCSSMVLVCFRVSHSVFFPSPEFSRRMRDVESLVSVYAQSFLAPDMPFFGFVGCLLAVLVFSPLLLPSFSPLFLSLLGFVVWVFWCFPICFPVLTHTQISLFSDLR